MSAPSTLPLEAHQQAAWDALWRRLLADPPADDEVEPAHNPEDESET